MTITKHTPGPWEYDRDEGKIVDANGDIVTHIRESRYVDDRDDPDQIKNISLIAAAPELLEALKKLVDAVKNDYKNGSMGIAHIFIDDALAVIAKAAGN